MKYIFLLSFFVVLNCLQKPITLTNSNKTIIKPAVKQNNCNRTRTICKNCIPIKHTWVDGISRKHNKRFKPVIYLYLEEPMDISVQIKLTNSEFTTIYPRFNEKNTWNVHAEPNGDIYIKDRKYPYLFWEANSYDLLDTNEGFLVSDEEAEKFLEEKLSILGLNDKEKTDFITFWLPVLLKNKLSLCSFQTQKYFDTMELNVTPKPDSMIRIFLAIKKLDAPINVKEQKLESVERKGFTVIEWGGTKL